MTQQQQHPITPPPELVEQWIESTRSDDCIGAFPADLEQQICVRAAQYGADQELEACCEWVGAVDGKYGPRLRLARRPKPPSLKEQALEALASAPGPEYPSVMTVLNADQHALIRRALEQLPDHE